MIPGGMCAVPDCGKRAHSRGWCPMHYTRWKRHGDPVKRLKGDSTGYYAVHYRLRKRGPASDHACVDCGAPAKEWAYDRQDPNELVGIAGGAQVTYSADLDRYQPRCGSCHKRLDQGHRRHDASGRFLPSTRYAS